MNTVTKTKYELKEYTKTVWIEVDSTTQDLTEDLYNNTIEAAPFFRRLGGTETLTRSYTCNGYVVTRLISKSPCKAKKSVYEFNFTGRLSFSWPHVTGGLL